MNYCVDFIRQYEPNQDGVGKYDAEMVKLLEGHLDESRDEPA